jgi:sialate O-acetylesterase
MSIHRILAAAGLLAMLCQPPAHAAEPLLNSIFQDHAVLQRNMPVQLWGQAPAGAAVAVTFADHTVQTEADTSGRWGATLPAKPAGGPYTLTVSDANGSQTINDVLVGDVWLCSGQSNMVLPVKVAIDAGADIATSANDAIRLLSVPDNTSPAPLDSLVASGKWQAAGPTTVPNFSAACYFFGRDLQKSVHVPIGLVVSAWDGANITSFESQDMLRKIGGFDLRLDALKIYAGDPKAGMAHWGSELESWWREHLRTQPGTEPWNAGAGDWSVAPAGLGYWTEWPKPALPGPGQVWFRTTVTLTAAQAAQASELSLGQVNEEDQSWVDGAFVGATFGYGTVRRYSLAAGAFHAGENTLTVEVLCTWKGCGMFGPASDRVLRLQDGTAVPLAGPWYYWVTPSSVEQAPRVPWGATAGLGMVYDAMIAPLKNYGFRGVAWYQGESNTGEPKEYRRLLTGLMVDWRQTFATDLPFLVVQLPDYGPPPVAPQTSSWAELRESQRAAVAADHNAALAVTIDIGDHYGLHPANKQEVGRRLALAARRLVYRESGVPTGPVAIDARRSGNSVVVRFADVDRRLVAYNADEPVGFELCAAERCRWAVAHIQGDTVRVQVPAHFRPTHVRYCWADGPVCTLYDSGLLPAGPLDLPLAVTGSATKHHVHRRKSRAR